MSSEPVHTDDQVVDAITKLKASGNKFSGRTLRASGVEVDEKRLNRIRRKLTVQHQANAPKIPQTKLDFFLAEVDRVSRMSCGLSRLYRDIARDAEAKQLRAAKQSAENRRPFPLGLRVIHPDVQQSA